MLNNHVMVKRNVYLSYVLVLLIFACSCSETDKRVTTFILIRHAEKGDDGTEDPDLKAEGVARAEKLAFMLKDTPLTAIYSTNFKRTRNTVKPVADFRNLQVQVYEAHKPDVLSKMIEQHRGGIVLVSGHTNTTPWTANLLLGKETFKDYDETEYGILLVVSVVELGRGSTVTRVNY
jgi:2,3-bisphosphoglycerate-dependent phosphoglycerate mutase